MSEVKKLPVQVTLHSIITDVDDDEPQRLHFTSEGTLTVSDTQYTVSYRESELTELGNTQTTLLIPRDKPDCLVLNRDGDVSCSLSFSCADNRQLCSYTTPFGPFSFVVHTQKLHVDFSETGGKLHVEYYIELRGAQAEFNRLSILVVPQKEFSL